MTILVPPAVTEQATRRLAHSALPWAPVADETGSARSRRRARRHAADRRSR